MVFSSFFEKAAKKEKKGASRKVKSQVKEDDSEAKQEASESFAPAKKKSKKKRKRPNDSDSEKPSDASSSAQPRSKGKGPKNHKILDNQQNTKNEAKDKKRRRHNNENNHKRHKAPPQAYELSKQLMDLSRRKKLEEALKLYWDESNNHFRDAHHACIVIDCCSRCGGVDRAQAVLEALPSNQLTIEVQTALIKGFAHAGDLQKAMAVFRSLIPDPKSSSNQNDKQSRIIPNVRTLNTLLRGCLWTAATQNGDTIAGGVVSSEEAWALYTTNPRMDSPPDTSSYEAAVTLLCQALRIEEAENRINGFMNQFNIRLKGKATIKTGENPDQSVLETLGALNLCLARAYALLEDFSQVWSTCQRSLHAIQASRKLLKEQVIAVGEDVKSNSKKRKEQTFGGKRGRQKNSEEDQANRRNQSNHTYREHRLNEMESDVKTLIKWRASRDNKSNTTPKDDLSSSISSSLFYFGGGGTTELADKRHDKSKETTAEAPKYFDTLTPIWTSFGLAALTERDDSVNESNTAPPSFVKEAHRRHFDSKGRLVVKSLFEKPSHPLDVELGAGFGDWIVKQACTNEERNHISVELRADRVYQIFAKGALSLSNSMSNLCVVGADAGSFLRDKLPKESISNLFVNHPEPPTQTFGDDCVDLEKVASGGMEPAHMLASATLEAIAQALAPNGRLVVVTDNRWYAKLLCITLVRLTKKSKKSLQCVQSSTMKQNGFREVESFAHGIKFFEGQPNQFIGHVESGGNGSSYFDRLWRTGTSNFAQRTARFVVVMNKGKV